MGSLNLESQDTSLAKLKNFYDGARGLLKQYLQKEQGAGIIRTKSYPGDWSVTNGVKITPIEGTDKNDGEFLDISHSDLGGIINPKVLKCDRTKNSHVRSVRSADDKILFHETTKAPSNAHNEEAECDDVSSEIRNETPVTIPILDSENIVDFDKVHHNENDETKSPILNDLQLEEIH